MIFSQLGLGIFLAGVTGEQFFKEDFERKLRVNDTFNLGEYRILFSKVDEFNGPNYISKSAEFNIFQNNLFIKNIRSEKRFYPVEKNQTTEAGIFNSLLGDIYKVFGDGDNKTGWTIRAYLNPLVSWIWYGVSFMALGGFISILNLNRKKKNEH